MIDRLSYELTQDAKDDLIAIRKFTYKNWERNNQTIILNSYKKP